MTIDTEIQINPDFPSEQIFSAFHEFLRIPISTRLECRAMQSAKHGYYYGFGSEDGSDEFLSLKEFFNYAPQCESLLPVHITGIPVVRKLMDAMFTGFVQAEKAALPVAEDLEQRFKELTGQLVDPNNKLSFRTLRVVQYAPVDVGSFLIKPHYDAGMVTICLSDTSRGLRYYAGSTVKSLRPSPTAAPVMYGLTAEALTSGGIKPVWHDVIQTQPRVPRSSILFFFGPRNAPFFERHLRYRQKEPA